jgi:hypothetical protein
MDRNTSNTSIKDIEQMSNEELRLLAQETSDPSIALATFREMNIRDLKQLSKPHWSVTPLFWISVVAAVAACIAAYPVLFPSQSSQPAAALLSSVQIIPPNLSPASSPSKVQ